MVSILVEDDNEWKIDRIIRQYGKIARQCDLATFRVYSKAKNYWSSKIELDNALNVYYTSKNKIQWFWGIDRWLGK